jgi:putative flippase GtrA
VTSRGAALLARHRRNLTLLGRFGVVGASGVLVNMITLIVLRKIGPHFDDAVVGLGSTDFNLRWYHVYSTVAFLVANLSNFQLNRSWTFRSGKAAGWWKEYWPFLVVGLGGQAIGLALLTLLMHPHSPVSLPTSVFDDSTGLRNRLYWSQLIVIALVTPLSFVLNKLWTFAAVRGGRPELADPLHEEEVVTGNHVV